MLPAEARAGTLDQCVQLPGLGPLGEGGAGAALRGAGLAKPATATAWLAQRMVADVVAAESCPTERCRSSAVVPRASLISFAPFDVVSFTGRVRLRTRSVAIRAVATRFGARQRRGRQPEQGAPVAGRRRPDHQLRPARAGGRPRDNDQVRPEVHRDPRVLVPERLFGPPPRRSR